MDPTDQDAYATAPAAPLAGRREWIGLAVLALACLLYAMDLTVLHLAVPSLSAELQPSSAELLWITDIYGFMVAGFLVTMGTLGDRIGRRRLLMIGAAAFGVLSILAAFSSSPGQLIAARALLGVAGATLAPSTLSLIFAMFGDPKQRSVAIRVWITSFSAGGAIGPVLGGVLLERFWWGSVFLLAVPVMALLLALAPRVLPEYKDPEAGRLDLHARGPPGHGIVITHPSRRSTMATDDLKNSDATSGAPDCAGAGAVTAATVVAGEHPFGPYAAQILGTEHWNLLATRLLIWNEAMSRATVFLTVLSASIIALALLADATGFGAQTTTLALVLLPVVFLLGLAAYARLVQINTEEFQLVLAMNRLRNAYLQLEPGLERYLTTGHHDDERGVLATYMLDRPTRQWLWVHFLVNTPTIVATVDAALAAAIVVLVLQAAEAPRAAAVAGGAVAFLAVWGVLFRLQLHTLRPLRGTSPRFPTPPEAP